MSLENEGSARLPDASLEVLHRLAVAQPIGESLLRQGFEGLLLAPATRARDCALGSLLTGMLTRGPEVDEVVTVLETIAAVDGIALASRPRVHVDSPARVVVVQGSGKKGIKTVNVSTPSCLLAAAAGAPVVKVGSRAGGARTGAYDLLHALGFDVRSDAEKVNRMVCEIGFGYANSEVSAPVFFRAYKGLFHFGHILMFGISPILSPVLGDVNLYGVAHPDVEFSAQVLARLGLPEACVVASTHDGIHYLDEVAVFGTTAIGSVERGNVRPAVRLEPARAFRLARYGPDDIREAPSVPGNVRAAVLALAGRGAPAHMDLLCANAAVILHCAEVCTTREEGFERARTFLLAGDALALLRRAIDSSGGSPGHLATYLAGTGIPDGVTA